MSRIAWLKIGAVAALWTIIIGAAVSGWMVGRSGAARQISELRQRLAADSVPKPSCGVEIELLDAPTGNSRMAANLFGLTLGGILPKAPQHIHLREMLTSH
ncbi:MAG TPA: hypothetical protein VIF14_11715 [Alphaproteobacteria bacterium]|jgi:hypothetical protein